MSKLLGTEDGYEIHLGQKNPSCYPCCWEGSVSACRSDLCMEVSRQVYQREWKTPAGRKYLS